MKAKAEEYTDLNRVPAKGDEIEEIHFHEGWGFCEEGGVRQNEKDGFPGDGTVAILKVKVLEVEVMTLDEWSKRREERYRRESENQG